MSGDIEGESANKNSGVYRWHYYRADADEAGGHWFTIEADDGFVWCAEVHRNSTPEGVTFG